eukprot:g18350.t1
MPSAGVSYEETATQEGSESSAEAAERKSRSDWILGLFFIFLVCLLWASSSIIVQIVADNIGYNQPFVFTYIGSSVISCLVPSYLGLSLLGLVRNPPLREGSAPKAEECSVLWEGPRLQYGTPIVFGGGVDGGVAYRELEATSDGGERPDAGTTTPQDHPDAGEETAENRLLGTNGGGVAAVNRSGRDDVEVLSTTRVVVADLKPARAPLKSHLFMFKISLSLSVVWYLSQWSYAASLGYTSVSSSTIISNSGALFAYLFNVAAGSERFTKFKTVGVFLALLGAILVGLGDKGDDDASKDSVWGDAAALAAAVGYGIYSTILTLRSPSADEVSMSLVLGYMGSANVLIFLPLLLGLALAPGVQALQGLTWHVVQLIVIRSVMDSLFSELLWAKAILLTTPTVATVGCSLTIPIAFASDFLLHGMVPNTLAVVGASLVVGGFYFVSDRKESVGGGGRASGGKGVPVKPDAPCSPSPCDSSSAARDTV